MFLFLFAVLSMGGGFSAVMGIVVGLIYAGVLT